jgi:similar to stage IV sporulation protein
MPEKLVNLAATHHVELWDISMAGPGFMVARVSLDGYRALRPLLAACGCRATIDARVGGPFLLARMSSRKLLSLGVVIFLATLYGLSAVVWTVEVVGAESVDSAQVRRVLEELGARRWAWRSTIDCDMLRREVMRSVEGLAWAGVEIQGTSLVVRLVEKALPEMPEGVIDIVARVDGVISRLILLTGDPLVAEGDTVTAGQVLVRGRPAERDGEKPVHARAFVQARVWHEGSASVPLLVQERIRTGRSRSFYRVRAGRISFTVGPWPRFAAYDTEELVRRFDIKRDGQASVEITTITQHEIHVSEVRLSRAEALVMARDIALQAACRGLLEDVRIMATNVSVSDEALEPDEVRVRVIVETLEEIAVPVEREGQDLGGNSRI